MICGQILYLPKGGDSVIARTTFVTPSSHMLQTFAGVELSYSVAYSVESIGNDHIAYRSRTNCHSLAVWDDGFVADCLDLAGLF